MSINLHVRDVPDEVHAELTQRAAAGGMTLRHYVVGVLTQHTSLPTMDHWLERVARRRTLALKVDVVAAVDASRSEDDRLAG